MTSKFLYQELQVEEWIKKSSDDELNARSILTHRDGTPGCVCFLSQQMAEKCLKAFLVHKKRWFPKIHTLDKLVELCGKLDSSFKELKESAIFLTEFYVPVRYPGGYPEFSWREAEEAFKKAEQVRDFVLNKLK